VEEVEVEAADKNARVKGDTGPRLDPQAFKPMHLAIPSEVELVARALLPTYATLKEESLQCSPVSHVQAHITTEQDSGADLEPPLSSVLPSKRAVEPSGPAPHKRARAPAETGEPLKSSRDEETRRVTRPEDQTLTHTSEGKMHPGAMHGRPPKPPSLCTQSPLAQASNHTDLKPKGRALQARQVDLDGDEGAHSDSWPQPGTNIEGQDVYLRASALLEGEKSRVQ
jgi:hypothetical protein